MTAAKYILKKLLKLVVLPVVLILRTTMLLAKLVGYLGSYIVSPLMLFILGCGIYYLIKTRWTDVAILFGMEVSIVLLLFGGLWIYCNVMDLCDSLTAFLHS